MTAIVKGKEIEVEWLWQTTDGRTMTAFWDERELAKVIADWEYAGVIERKSDLEGDKVYTGCNNIISIRRERVGGSQRYTLTIAASVE